MNGNTTIGSLAMQLRHHDIMQESMLQFFQLCPGVQITVVWINSYVMSYGFNTRSVLTMAAAKVRLVQMLLSSVIIHLESISLLKEKRRTPLKAFLDAVSNSTTLFESKVAAHLCSGSTEGGLKTQP